jgi:DNA invertase Pin-like site-specific DNA recombinase
MGGNGRPLVPYMRQSRRRERTISIDEQRRLIGGWKAANDDVPVGAEFVEQNVSGSKPWRQRALGDAVAACEAGEAGGIIVAWQDRLSRENGLATAEVWEALKAAGARLVCVGDGIDTATGDQEMLFTIKAAIARDGWKRYQANFEATRRNAVERGVFPGMAPIGYRHPEKPGPLRVVRREERKVLEAFELRAAGEPYSRIARRFGWFESTTRYLLGNEAYLGVVRHGEFRRENAHPAIVSRELFDAVQAARTVQSVPPGDTTRDRLLVGLARCGGCGATLRALRRKSRDGSYYVSCYFCVDRGKHRCPDRAWVRADVLDEFVAGWFAGTLESVPRMVDVVAAGRDLEQAQAVQAKAQAQLNAYMENADATNKVLFRRGQEAREKRVREAEDKVRHLSARRIRLPAGGPLPILWEQFDTLERREVLAGFLDRVQVSRGASANLAGNVRIFWVDGTIAQDESGVGVAAA